ncbi:MAG: helix-turn-helix domain-containing protein [Oscillospiraceae bacterium]|nr:helix-turn-helix domain-containing protein [Oscillospiraceae bacterium]
MDRLFEHYIETSALHCKYARGEPAVKNQEFHDYHEFVLFLSGKAYFISKNIQQSLTPGSIVLIPREQFHEFIITSPEAYTRCILGFWETDELSSLIREVMRDTRVIFAPDDKIRGLFDDLTEAAQGSLSREEKALLAKSVLIRLLLCFKQYDAEEIRRNINISPTVQKAMDMIDSKFRLPLTVESIARELYVSPSTLAHRFSKELHISIYRYITKKRLLAVQQCISRGESAAAAAVSCGFRDYSCYYRLQKKYGREDPRQE